MREACDKATINRIGHLHEYYRYLRFGLERGQHHRAVDHDHVRRLRQQFLYRRLQFVDLVARPVIVDMEIGSHRVG
jgi:hypothetical protein